MKRAPLFRLAIVILITLSGCGGSINDGSRPPETESITPAPIPSTQSSSGRLAPGVTADGVENATALAVAHNTTLRNTSFTLRRNITVRNLNGTLNYRAVRTVEVGQRSERIYALINVTRSESPVLPFVGPSIPTHRAVWFNGKRFLGESVYANGTTTYDESVINDSNRLQARRVRQFYTQTGADYVETALNGLETRVVGRVIRNGTTLYRIESTAPILQGGLAPYPPPETSENITVHALVDSRGVMHWSNLSYTTRIENGMAVNVSQIIRVTSISSTTIERPHWYENATSAPNGTDTTTTNARIEAIRWTRFMSVSTTNSLSLGFSIRVSRYR